MDCGCGVRLQVRVDFRPVLPNDTFSHGHTQQQRQASLVIAFTTFSLVLAGAGYILILFVLAVLFLKASCGFLKETVYPRICPGRFLALDVVQAIVPSV